MIDYDSEIRALMEREEARKEGVDYVTHLETKLVEVEDQKKQMISDIEDLDGRLKGAIDEERAAEPNAVGIRIELSKFLKKYREPQETK